MSYPRIPKNFKPSKQVRETWFNELADMTESGELTFQEAFVFADHLEKFAKSVKDRYKKEVGDNEEAFGAVIKVTGGNKKVDYDADPVIQELKKAIKDRQALLDAAAQNNVADADTGEIISVKFKTSNVSKTVHYEN